MASFEFDQHLPISAASVQLMVQLAARRGWSADECLAGSGIDPGVLDDPFAEITACQEFEVMRNLDQLRCGEPGFWVEVGTNYHAGMHGSWGMALLTSRTLRDVIELTAEFVELAWVFTTITVTEYVDTGEVGIAIDSSDLPPDVASILVERISAAITSILRDLTNTGVPASSVRFRHAAPSNTSRYIDAFGTEPSFDADRNELVGDSAWLDTPLPQANDLVRRGYEAACRDLLGKRRARTGFAGAVRDVLTREPGRIPPLDEVAGALNVSPRTLARRLADEGAAYRALVDELRQALAEELLRNSPLTTAQIANRLGYTDSANFIRAFKRWRNMTPRSFRSMSASQRKLRQN
ncbi:AraC family transcriptional regulator [Nocardia fluminea]|uniref:AraC family transcriptional regulator n=1 Tax=Nocardia fluminea TaxID=134984 RepID=UPI0036517F92